MPYRIFKPLHVALLLVSFLFIGCNSGERIGAVHGTVSFEGKPLTEGTVQFSDPVKGIFISAPIQSDGSYKVATEQGQGLPLGTYQVCITPPVPVIVTGQPIPPMKPHDDIPQRYRDITTSGLKVEVVPAGVEFKIEMKP